MSAVGQARPVQEPAADGRTIAAVQRALYGVVVASVALTFWASARGFPYWDDYVLQGRAVRNGLLDPRYLLQVHDGHLMPGALFVAWLTAHLAPLSPLAIAVQVSAAHGLASVLMLRLLARMFGWRPWLSVPLVVFTFGPLTLPSTLWWSAALNALPLQIGALLAVHLLITYLQTRDPRDSRRVVVCLAVTLLFFEKAVLIPVMLVGVALSLDRRHLRDAVRGTWREDRRLWVSLAAVEMVYTSGYLLLNREPRLGGASVGTTWDLLRFGVTHTVAPSLLGGPLDWTPVGFASAIVDPPRWLIWSASVAVAALVVGACLRHQAPRRAWTLVLTLLLLDVALLTIGRGWAPGSVFLAFSPRYFADLAIPATLACAWLIDGRLPQLPVQRRTHGEVAVAVTAASLVLALSVVSTVQLADIWADNSARRYVRTASHDLALAPRGVALLPEPVPENVLSGLSYPNNLTDVVLAPVRQRPPFMDETTELSVLDPRGHLVPGRLRGIPAKPGPDAGCGWRADDVVRVPLTGRVAAFHHVGRIGYLASRETAARVQLASGPVRTVNLRAGLHAVYFLIEGGGRSFKLEIEDKAASVCVADAAFGLAEPAPDMK